MEEFRSVRFICKQYNRISPIDGSLGVLLINQYLAIQKLQNFSNDDGQRIEKTVNGQTTCYHYDGDSINILYETDAAGTVLRQYVYSVDGVRLAMKSQGQTLYYHYNPHGDVVAMTDVNGNVAVEYTYDAWGNELKRDVRIPGVVEGNPFGYAGYMYDRETGLYYLMARYYHPMHGVFLSVDPDPGDADDPITQNGYTYGDNNPVISVDPDGKKPIQPTKTVVKVVAGFVICVAYLNNRILKTINIGTKLAKKATKGLTYKGKLPSSSKKTAIKSSINKINDSYLKRKCIDAHELKKDVLGKSKDSTI